MLSRTRRALAAISLRAPRIQEIYYTVSRVNPAGEEKKRSSSREELGGKEGKLDVQEKERSSEFVARVWVCVYVAWPNAWQIHRVTPSHALWAVRTTSYKYRDAIIVVETVVGAAETRGDKLKLGETGLLAYH